MTYTKLFSPKPAPPAGTTGTDPMVDNADPMAYVFSDEIVLAVNVALASGRPLLVRGPSGVGKSSLARAVAAHMGRRVFAHVVNVDTRAQDFLWQNDELKRLRDAQMGAAMDLAQAYITPGVLFWAFDPAGARDVLSQSGRAALAGPPVSGPSVVLIDEIDKADPDVPNGLLEPLGFLSFDLPDLGRRISADTPPLIVITTNEERDLPQAFLRRCVELNIAAPTRDQLVEIAVAQFPSLTRPELEGLADKVLALATAANLGLSTAEFIDTVKVVQTLGIASDDPLFDAVVDATALKSAGDARDDWA
ncbi:MAG: MoxR family ATPase [Pseudomonadota bacterium]